MKTINDIVIEKIAAISESGAIEQAIEDALKSSVNSIIETQLSKYSNFGKAVGKAIEESIKIDPANFNLPSYNNLILELIRRSVDNHMTESLSKRVEEDMREILSAPEKEVKLSELIDEFIKQEVDHNYSCDLPDEMTLHLEKTSFGYWNIFFDKDSCVSKYQCAYRISVTEKGEVYSVQIDGKDPKKSLFMGRFYGVEKRIFNLYASGAKLIVDGECAEDFDISYPEQE
jgi:hypothetical protein